MRSGPAEPVNQGERRLYSVGASNVPPISDPPKAVASKGSHMFPRGVPSHSWAGTAEAGETVTPPVLVQAEGSKHEEVWAIERRRPDRRASR